jgi:hypothetical protein
MLFDLRGRGRRRTIQVIYLFLAVLIGGGLIFFGIGGGSGSGGLLNAVNGNGTSASNAFNKRLHADERLANAQPQNPDAWAQVATDRYELALSNFSQTTGAFTGKASGDLRAAQQAWNHYLTLKPAHPDPALASKMSLALVGINDIAGATTAWEIFVASQPPSAGLYAKLAEYAYAAKQTRKGDLAAQKAVSLAPKAQQATLKSELDTIKKNPTGSSTPSTTGGSSGSGTMLPSG